MSATATRRAKEQRLAARRQLFDKADTISKKCGLKVYTLLVDENQGRWYSYVTSTDSNGNAFRKGMRRNGELPVPVDQADSPLFAPVLFSHDWGDIDPDMFKDEDKEIGKPR